MNAAILVLNAGSSSIKYALYAAAADGPARLRGVIERIGSAPSHALHGGTARTDPGPLPAHGDHDSLIARLLEWLDDELGSIPLVAAGHRVVHGGAEFAHPVRIDSERLARIEALAPLAPRHQPANLAGVHAIARARPALVQVACFDTAFHRSQPRRAQLFAIPRALSDAGIVRYGFHGLSYEYIAGALPAHLGAGADGRIVVAHLGHGASLCALHGRRSVATSMGFSALDGLVMGRRPGNLDAGVILHLLQRAGMSVSELEHTLYERCGLLGVSGLSDDMRDLLGSDHAHAREAVELFVYRAVREIGALAAVLGGLDALVFTAGIGAHAPAVRAAIVEQLAWLGLRLDAGANARHATFISTRDSRVSALVLPTDEEAVIAAHTRRLYAG